MDFRNINRLNTLINMISGNLLPLTADARVSAAWQVYYAVVMFIEIVHTVALIFGLVLVPAEKALKDGTVCVVITVEAFFMLARLYTRKDLTTRVIDKINQILRSGDETMKEIVRSALKRITVPYGIYGVISVTTVSIWTVVPIGFAFERSSFYYTDYNLPAAFTTSEPFSVYVLVPSSVFMTIGSVYLFLKKFGVDMYMMHLVLLLTAQYRYIAIKLMMFFRRSDYGDKNRRSMHRSRTDHWARKELRQLCRQHNNIMRVSFMLKDLLSVNFSIIYVNSVLRFCFLGVMMSTIPSMTLIEATSVVFFICASTFQFLLLCLCVQMLSDASIEVTNKSFGEDWYEFGIPVKRTFMLLMMANNAECKLAAFGKFNLSLPSFMTIMNQSYSIALVLMRAN